MRKYVQLFRHITKVQHCVPAFYVHTQHVSLFTSALNEMSMYLPKRLELSLRLVLALPNASSTGLDCRSLSLTVSTCALWPVTAAMNCRTFFDASVFPEPDSPAQTYVDQA